MPSLTPEMWEAFRRDPSEERFEPLYEGSKRLVYTICRRILRAEEHALDAFQATYCRILELARDREKASAIDDIAKTFRLFAIREADNLRKRRTRRTRREAAMNDVSPATFTELSKAESALARTNKETTDET